MHDWVKIRALLPRDPKVRRMADYLASDPRFIAWMLDDRGAPDSAYEVVTRNVMAALCVTGLAVTWATARQIGDRVGDDLILDFCDFDAIEDMAEIPNFGLAMQLVGWLEDRGNGVFAFPKFFKTNETPDDRFRRQNAERQARFREKHNATHNVTRNVTETVTRNGEVTDEKRREEKIKTSRPSGDDPLPDGFAEFWIAYPRKVKKRAAIAAWRRLKPDDALRARIMAALAADKRSDDWTRDDGRFVPHPPSWLNGARWDDDRSPAKSSSLPYVLVN